MRTTDDAPGNDTGGHGRAQAQEGDATARKNRTAGGLGEQRDEQEIEYSRDEWRGRR